MPMPPPDLVLRSRRVVTQNGIRDAVIEIREGRIDRVAAPEDLPSLDAVEDLGERVILPGLVDTHVHINEPGRTEWEGFATATRAAAAGGVTTLVDMPLNCHPVTTSAAALETKTVAAQGNCFIDVGFYGGLIPTNPDRMPSLAATGVLGIKTFLCPSGIEEFPAMSEADLLPAMRAIAKAGLPLLVHAELIQPRDAKRDPRLYSSYLASRPPVAEEKAIALMIDLCRASGCSVHIVHLSSAESLAQLERARDEGLPISVETCPHYLFFSADSIGAGQTQFKCAPPIRGGSNRQRLWAALREGTIDLIATDHSPCPEDLKAFESGDFETAWGGIPSLGLALSVVWTAGRPENIAPEHIARWMSEAPARLVGLEGRKGSIAPGHDADLVVWDPDARWTVSRDVLHYRCRHTPYEGLTLQGTVERTYLRGRPIYRNGELVDEPLGEILTRAS